MLQPIAMGVSIGVLGFLLYIGVDITPYLVIGSFGIMAYLMVTKKGLVKLNSYQQVSTQKSFKFEDIGGQETAKQELREALNFLVKQQDTDNLGIRPLKGILLTGPPGTGKTLLAKAAAAYSDSIFLATSGSEFIEMYAGVGAQRVRQLFSSARKKARSQKKQRAIIFIDEIEILGGKRGANTSHMEYDQTLNQLLVEMDGLTTAEDVQILLIGATNRPDMLDSALLRPGRFDRQVKVDLPDKEGRLQILKLHTRVKPLANDSNLEEIAQETFGFSGAHLENVCNEAAILALRDGASQISHQNFKEAIDKVMMGEKLGKSINPEVQKRVAIHEAGHAIISEAVRPGSVAQVTVTSRNNALGYVRQTQQNDLQLYTKKYLEDQIKICLAGAIAEEIYLGEKSTGAGNDFNQAVDIASKIIHTGLSSLGIISIEHVPEELIHRTIKEIISSQEEKTKTLLMENQAAIDLVVDELVKIEKITGTKLRELLSCKVAMLA